MTLSAFEVMNYYWSSIMTMIPSLEHFSLAKNSAPMVSVFAFTKLYLLSAIWFLIR